MGYQQQEFDEESGELINADDEDPEEEFSDDFDEMLEEDAYEEQDL